MKPIRAVVAALAVSVLLLLGAVSPARAEGTPLATSTSTVTVTTSAGRSFSARLVQPRTVSDHDYPVVGFGHGFAQSSSRYDSTLKAIAGRGYVVIAPNTQTGLLPSHGAFADDLVAAIAWAGRTVPSADADRTAVVGHSMGGGAALLAADREPSIDTVITLAAAETRPSAVSAAGRVEAPALFVVGSKDTVVKPSTTRRMYDAKPSPATWVSITGGYHCGFVDSSSFFGLGCDSGSIARSTQLSLTATVVGDWLDRRLGGADPAALPAGTVTESK